MAMEEEEDVWRSPSWLYPAILTTSTLLLFYRNRQISKEKDKDKASPFFSASLPVPFLSFQRRFLIVFFLASAAEYLQAIYGEMLLENKGFKRRDMAMYFVLAHLSGLILGPFFGVLTDHIGRKKACLFYCFLQMAGAILKQTSDPAVIWGSAICQGLATSLLLSAFESWLVTENDKLGFHQDWVTDTFWIMSFGSAVVAIGTGGLANFLLRQTAAVTAPLLVSVFVAFTATAFILLLWDENSQQSHGKVSGTLRSTVHVLYDKKVILLGFAYASIEFAMSIFWFLWTPTLVADGRGLHNGMLFPCLMASQMVGSVISAMLLSGPWNIRGEDFLRWVFLSAAFVLAVPSYDYQEIGVLVSLFCAFHICYGIAWPSLARLRSILVPPENRAAIITLFRVPPNIAAIFILVNGGIKQHLENSKIFGLSVAGLCIGAYCLHSLNRLRHQSHGIESRHRM